MKLSTADINLLYCGLCELSNLWEGSCMEQEMRLVTAMKQRLMDELAAVEAEQGGSVYPNNCSPVDRLQIDIALKSNFPVTCWQQEDFDAIAQRGIQPYRGPDREPLAGHRLSDGRVTGEVPARTAE